MITEAETSTAPDEQALAPGRILVTGGTGFVGPKIVHALRVRDLPVRCLVRDPTRARQLENWGCELARGDITDAESVRRAMEGCDRVIHLVAILKVSDETADRVVIGGARNVIAAARDVAVERFVLMSALGTTEESKDDVPYYRAKWTMEQMVEGAELEYVIFRPSFVFGPDGGILPTLVRQIRLAPVTPIPGNGKQRVQPIWVDDVAEYFARALELPEAANRTFELAGPEVVTWDELYTRIKRVLGKRRPAVHIPFPLLSFGARFTERIRSIPLGRGTVKMLQGPDNVAANDDAQQTFGIPLVPLDEQIRRGAT